MMMGLCFNFFETCFRRDILFKTSKEIQNRYFQSPEILH